MTSNLLQKHKKSNKKPMKTGIFTGFMSIDYKKDIFRFL